MAPGKTYLGSMITNYRQNMMACDTSKALGLDPDLDKKLIRVQSGYKMHEKIYFEGPNLMYMYFNRR